MKYINSFKSMTDFSNDKKENLNQPRVALVKENGGVNNLFYIKFKLYTENETSYLNIFQNNSISFEDIPVKTTTQDIPNDESMKSYGGPFRDVHSLLPIEYHYASNLLSYLTVTPDSLDLIENGKLITKFTLTGLKRKNSDERDFVGEIAFYLDKNNQPLVYKVDRTNADHPTVTLLSGQEAELSKYMDNHEIEKRTKSVHIYFDYL